MQVLLAPCRLGKEAKEAQGIRSLEKVTHVRAHTHTHRTWWGLNLSRGLAAPGPQLPITHTLGKGTCSARSQCLVLICTFLDGNPQSIPLG